MKSFQTLLRRTAVGLTAIAALIVTGYATSQTVELRNSSGAVIGSCQSYSTMTVTPAGGVVVTCGSSTSGPTFKLVAPPQLPVSTTTNNEVQIQQTGTTTDPTDVSYSVAGAGCTNATNQTVTFPAGGSSSQDIPVTTLSTVGASCTITITPPQGMAGSPTSKTVTLVNPDGDVTFAFASNNPTSASMGGSAVNITVTRTGGTNNTWQVPVVVKSTGSLGPVGQITGSPLVFGPGILSASVSYVPPAPTGSSGTVVLGFGALTDPNTSDSQNGFATDTHTLNLSTPPAGCPAPEASVGSLGPGGFVNVLRGASVLQATYALPETPTGFANIGLYSVPYTPTTGNLLSEIHISKCKGMGAAPVGDSCYIASSSPAQVSKVWQTQLTTKLSTPAKVAAAGRCYAPASEGPWYINIRVTYDSCPTWGTCGWQPIWKPQES